MDTDGDAHDLFERLLSEDLHALVDTWNRLADELEEIDTEQRELASRRTSVEARRSVLTGIFKLHDIATDNGTDTDEADRPPTIKDLARRLIDEQPERAWNAEQLHNQMSNSHGVETTRSNVRMILQRLTKDGSIRRVGRGAYQSALAGSSATLLDEELKT